MSTFDRLALGQRGVVPGRLDVLAVNPGHVSTAVLRPVVLDAGGRDAMQAQRSFASIA